MNSSSPAAARVALSALEGEPRRTNSGRFIHRAYSNTLRTFCGVKAPQAIRWEDAEKARLRGDLCAHCFAGSLVGGTESR